MYINDDVKYIGVNDKQIDLFESLYPAPNGMAYNSYVVLDEKIAVMDTMDRFFIDEWYEKLEMALNGRKPDYLIVHHMEPDHSAGIKYFADKYPDAVIVSNKQSFPMMKGFFGDDFADRRIEVADGSELSLGKYTLKFVTAPMVHWPEVIMTYVPEMKLVFSADAFGKFGTLDVEDNWVDEARRYFFSIVGKFGVQTAKLLGKIEGLPIETICSLHGPVLKENISYYVSLYKTWANYDYEEDGICICYCSVYGHTKAAVEKLADNLKKEGRKVSIYDLARSDVFTVLADAFKYSHLLLASPTYYGEPFPFMGSFIQRLKERTYKKRKVYLVENGSWMPNAANRMKVALDGLDIELCEKVSTIRGAATEDITIEW